MIDALREKNVASDVKSTIPGADLRWADKHRWIWTGKAFVRGDRKGPDQEGILLPHFIMVIPNPMSHRQPGWVVWLAPCGALQMDAPWTSVRAALRVAEQIYLQKTFRDDEMSCAEDAEETNHPELCATWCPHCHGGEDQ